MNMRAELLNRTKAVARRVGVDLSRYRPPDPRRGPDPRRARLLGDHMVDLVLDVGAHNGTYAQRLRGHGYGGSIVSFEPRRVAFARLAKAAAEDSSWHCVRTALGSSDADMTINQAANEESSSLLVMDERLTAAAPEIATIGQERVSVRRLDGIDLPQSSALMLKADVQGYEAEVLEGAAGILPTVRLVEFELSIVELYEGQPLLRDMLNLLATSGFELALLEPGFQDPRDGTILQFDGIFQRSERAA